VRAIRRLAVAAAAALVAPASAGAALSPAQLLARHQPVTILHPDEQFRPVGVEGFLSDAVLERRAPDGIWTLAGPASVLPTADPPDCVTTDSSPCWRLRIPACSAAAGVPSLACYAGLEAAHPMRSVVYGAVHRRGNRIALQYWYWYSYNFWSGLHPPTDYVWQAHEGDWELVSVVLDRAGKPLFAAYSEHSCGKRRAWRAVPKWRRTQHPVVHVALGSHANSFSSRTFPIDLRPQCYSPLGAALLRAFLDPPVDRVGAGARLGPRLPGVGRTAIVRLTASSPSWMSFPGRWGEGNYLHAPEPLGTEFAGPAPPGPRFRRIWRDPVRAMLAWPRG
jgi:hypothetical protein